jgi:hypothetical protein
LGVVLVRYNPAYDAMLMIRVLSLYLIKNIVRIIIYCEIAIALCILCNYTNKDIESTKHKWKYHLADFFRAHCGAYLKKQHFQSG